MNPRIKSVKPLCDYQLLLEFTNDEVGIYDCKPLLNFGVFKELQDINYFNQVHIIGDSVAWINEQDICPDTLYLNSIKIKGKLMILNFQETANSSLSRIPVQLTERQVCLFCERNSDYLDKSGNQFIVKEKFFIDKKVKDKWRYNLVNNNGWKLIRANGNPIICASRSRSFHIRDKIITINEDDIPIILIILESPHNDEYSSNEIFSPLSPANGDTGVKFEKYFITHVLPIFLNFGINLDKKEYKIYFINPVPTSNPNINRVRKAEEFIDSNCDSLFTIHEILVSYL